MGALLSEVVDSLGGLVSLLEGEVVVVTELEVSVVLLLELGGEEKLAVKAAAGAATKVAIARRAKWVFLLSLGSFLKNEKEPSRLRLGSFPLSKWNITVPP